MKIQFLFQLLLVGMLASAQTGFNPVKNETEVRNQFAKIPTAISSIESAFNQEKNLAALSDKLISKGKFFFEKDNKVRLEYQSPFKYLMVMNNGKMMMKDEGKTTKVDLKSNKIFQQINRIMIDCVNGTALSNSDFSTKILENNTQYRLEMTPVSKGLKDFFKVICVFIDKKDYTAIRIEMHEHSGDNTIISFTNKELNKKLDTKLFAVN
jgi:outer membrane lipoprotein-sorting protein